MSTELATGYLSLAVDTRGVGAQINKVFAGASKSAAQAGVDSGKSFSSSMGGHLKSAVNDTIVPAVKVTGAAVAGVLGYSLVKGFSRLTAIDDAEAKLSGLGHSAGQVKSIMNDSLASVKGTAFGLDEAATIAASAVAAGIKPGQDLQRTLKDVADAATIGGTTMGEMGSIFNKVAASGKAYNGDLQQLSDRGIPVYQLLGKQLHKTTDEVFSMASAGKINFKTFRDAMESGMQGAALKSGNTVTGALKNVQAALGRFGAGFLQDLFPHLKVGFKNLITFIDNATAAVAPVAQVIGKVLGTAFEVLTAKMAKIDFTKVTGFFTHVKNDTSSFHTFAAALGNIGTNLKNAFTIIAHGDLRGMSEDWAAKNSSLVHFLINLRDVLIKAGGALKDWASKINFSAVLDRIQSSAAKAWPTIKSFISVLPSIGSGAGKGIIGFLGAVTPGLQTFAGVLPAIGTSLGGVVNSALDTFSKHTKVMLPLLLAAVGAWIASKKALELEARAHLLLQAAQLKALPLTTLNNALTLTSGIVNNQAAQARIKAAAAETLATGAQVKNNVVTGEGILALVAQKGALLASAAAQKVAAAGQWLLNAAMDANPIGLVVIAIGALVAGIIIAYKHSATFRAIVTGAWNGIRDAAQAVWGWLKKNFIPFFTDTIPNAFHKFLGVTTSVGNAILAFFKVAWKPIDVLIVTPIRLAIRLVQIAFKDLRGPFTDAVKWVGSTFKAAWHIIQSVIMTPIDWAAGKIKQFWADEVQGWKDIAHWISTAFSKAWSAISGVLSGPVGDARDAIHTSTGKIKDAFNTVWGWVSGPFKKGWNAISSLLSGPISDARTLIKNVFDKIKSDFQGVVDAIKKIWAGIQSAVKVPVKFVVGTVIDKVLIGGFNKIAEFAWGNKNHDIGTVNLPPGFAPGGILPGRTPYHQGDDRLVPMRGGEGVYVTEAMDDPYERKRLFAMNAAALRGIAPKKIREKFGEGFAGGGLVNWKGGTFTPQFAQLLQNAQKMAHVTFQIFQGGFRPATSYSGTSHAGDAVDLGPVTAAVVKVLRSLGVAAWRRGPAQGFSLHHIHGVPLPGYGKAGGSGVWQAQDYLRGGDGLGGKDYEARTAIGAAAGAGGAGAGFTNWVKSVGGGIGGAAKSLFKHVTDPLASIKSLISSSLGGLSGSSGLVGALKQIPGRLISELKGKVTGFLKNTLNGGQAGVGAVGGPMTNGRAIAKSFMTQRYGAALWPDIDFIGMHESGWSPFAKNPKSGAYGVGQALPASKMAKYGADYMTNELTQLKWMGGYMDGTYGGPRQAAAFWKAHNWYAAGGILPKKLDPLSTALAIQMGVKAQKFDTGGYLEPHSTTLAVNGTNRRERVGFEGDGPMIGQLTLVSKNDNVKEDLAEVDYQLRVMKRRGVDHRGVGA